MELQRDLDALIRRGEIAAASELAARYLAAHPGDADAHAGVARVLVVQGRHADAVASFERVLAIDPQYRRALLDLAALFAMQRRLEEASALIERLLACDGAASPEALFMHALLLSEQHRYDDALVAVDDALARYPQSRELTALRAGVLRWLGRYREALDAQNALLAREPGFAPAWSEKGWVLRALGEPPAALDAFEAALAIDPQLAAAWSGKGLALFDLGRYSAALAAYETALAHDPQAFEARFGHASTLEQLKRYDEAREAYETFVAEQPENADVFSNLGNVYRNIGRLDDAEEALRHSLALQPDRPLTHSNLLLTMLYRPDVSPEALLEAHNAYGRQFGAPAGRYTSWPNDLDPDRPLAVGVLSAELFRHAVAPWLMPLLDGRDPERLSLTCYSMRHTEDELTEQIKGLVDGWHQVVGLNDQELASRIRDDGIDVLLEISGHTTNNRLACLALKPAPVQAHWLGYPYTTGLEAIDFIIMDSVAVRPGEEVNFAETVIRLPGGRFCYQAPAGAPRVAAPPVMRRQTVTFGSFNNLTKLSDDVLDAWCTLLHRVPTARLVIKATALDDREAAEQLAGALVERGIAADRFELRGTSSYVKLLGEYADIDIALDPFPFCGGATSCDALWMGVPVVTLPGWQPVSRQTEGFLRAIGRSEWIARDRDDYIDIATRLASNPLRLQDLRLSQRDEMRNSALCDVSRLCREMDDAIRFMWQRYVDKAARPQA